MADLQIKQQSKQLSAIPVSWDSTTVPEVPVSLPIGATVRVTDEGLEIHAERKGSLAADESADVHIPRDQITAIDVYLMPDIAAGTDPWSAEGQESFAVIRTADPFGVVPFFELKLSSWKSYWMRAFAKLAKERLGIDPQISEETQSTRKVRQIRQNK